MPSYSIRQIERSASEQEQSHLEQSNSNPSNSDQLLRMQRNSSSTTGNAQSSSTLGKNPMDGYMRARQIEARSQDSVTRDFAFEQQKANMLRAIGGSSYDFGAFFSTLRSTISSLPNTQAALIVQSSSRLIAQQIIKVDSQAKESDGGQFNTSIHQDPKGLRSKFDRAVANLSGVMQHISGCITGDALVSTISTQIASLISKRNDIGRWDEALGNTLINGDFATIDQVKSGEDVPASYLGQGSTILATQVVTLLHSGTAVGFGSNSDADRANDILENIEKSANVLAEASKTLTERTSSDNQLLQTNIAHWGGFATEEQLQRAIEAEKESHGTFEQLDAMAGNTLDIFDSLQRLQSTLPEGNKYTNKLQDRVNQYIEHFSDAIELAPSASSHYDNLVSDWSTEKQCTVEDEKGLLDTVVETSSWLGKGKSALTLLANFHLKADTQSLLSAAAAGQNSEALFAMNSLISKSRRLGLDRKQLDDLQQSFAKFKNAPSQANLENFNTTTNKIEVFSASTGIGRTMKIAGLMMVGVSLASDIAAIKKEGFSFDNTMELAADSIGLGRAGLSLIAKNPTWKQVITSKLNLVSNALSTATLIFSVAETIDHIADGEWTAAALSGMGVLSGALALMGMSGPAFAVGLAAVAIGMQVARVQASNVLETKHTEAFLMELGIPQEVAYHLRNADNEGRSIGGVLQEVMNKSSATPEEFVKALSSLSPQKAQQLAEAAHGVDPDSNGVYPLEHKYDEYVGLSESDFRANYFPYIEREPEEQYSPYFNVDKYTRPQSIQGMILFIERSQIALPV